MLLRAALIALVLGPPLSGVAHAQSCATVERPQTRALMKSGQVRAPARAIARARSAASGDAIAVRLCGAAAQYRYIVTILGQDGRVRRVSLDARTLNVLSVK